VFTLGYTGFIVGPPIIGVLSDHAGLPQTLALLILALLTVTMLGGKALSTSDNSRADVEIGAGEVAGPLATPD
jgi:MFS family permease